MTAQSTWARIRFDLLHGKLSHAVLLDGGTQQERLQIARDTARALVCSGNEPPCGICAHCKKSASDMHPDIMLFSGGTTVGSFKIDTVREIRQAAVVMPNEAERKVFILENAESMGNGAQNALLKILEEPPKYVSFILTCASQTQLLPTILSRVSVYTLDAAAQADLSEHEQSARSAAEQLLLAASEQNEVSVLQTCAAFEKNKEAFRLCCAQLAQCASEALQNKIADVPASSTIEQIAARMSRAQLYQILHLANDTAQYIAGNINGNLLLSWFSASLIAGTTEG